MRNIAFVVGTQKYTDLQFEDLPCVKYDVQSIKAAFLSNCACAEHEIFSYLDVIEKDRPINPEVLIREIKEKGSRFSNANIDTLLFYYSGHGFLAEEKPHICFTDSIYESTVGTLSIDLLAKTLSSLRIAKHTVIILDTCQSVLMAKGSGELTMKGSVSIVEEGVIIFHSCSPRQRSYAYGDGSIFTRLLVEILKNTKSYFTVKEISSALKEKTEEYARKNNYKPDFQIPRTTVYDVSLAEVEVKQRHTYTVEKPATTEANVKKLPSIVPLVPWSYHRDRIYKVYFSVNIHSSDEILKLMRDVVLAEGDLPILYGSGNIDADSLAGKIDDSDFVVILLDSSINNSELISREKCSGYIDKSFRSIDGNIPLFLFEYSYALQKQKHILILYRKEYQELRHIPNQTVSDTLLRDFVRKVVSEKRKSSNPIYKEVPPNFFADKGQFELDYVKFKSDFKNSAFGYEPIERNKLLRLLNKSIQLDSMPQTVGSYVVTSDEMERTIVGDELHILTNDLLNYDFTPISSLTIAINTKKGVHYYYYGTLSKQQANEFKENIKMYYRKSFKARRLIVQWIRRQKSKEFNYTEFLNKICNNTVRSYIEDLLVNVAGQSTSVVDELISKCLEYDPRCLEEDYLRKINVEKLKKWIYGEHFGFENDVYNDISKLNVLRQSFVQVLETWDKYVSICDSCKKIELLVMMSQLTQWQASSDRDRSRRSSFSISNDEIACLFDRFQFFEDNQTERNLIITDVMNEWMSPKKGEILCGEDPVSEEEMEEYLSRIHFFQLKQSPYILAYNFCLFLCDEGPEAAWYTTYAKTDGKTPNKIAVDNNLMMVELDKQMSAELQVVFSRLITENDYILRELERNDSRILRRLGIKNI